MAPEAISNETRGPVSAGPRRMSAPLRAAQGADRPLGDPSMRVRGKGPLPVWTALSSAPPSKLGEMLAGVTDVDASELG